MFAVAQLQEVRYVIHTITFLPLSVPKKCIFQSKKCISYSKTAFSAELNFSKFWSGEFEKLGLEEITEIGDLVMCFLMSVWLQKSAWIQLRTSLLK